jgi:hypothetical protein
MIHPEVLDTIAVEVRKALAATVGREVVAPLTGRMARLEIDNDNIRNGLPEAITKAVEAAVAPLAARVEELEGALEAYRKVTGSGEKEGGKKK